jgi:uncharacterized protein
VTPASCVYEGWVRHRRFTPVERAFRYPLYLVYLDLDELPDVLARSRLWSAIARFERRDQHGDPARPLRDEVLDLVEAQTGRRPGGPVRVLTQLRHFGIAFNPVSFYYCFEPDEQLAAVAAMVTNTPWGERHAYVLGERVGKEMHVSPFLSMHGEYACRLTVPGRALQVHIESPPAFDATLSLLRRELEPAFLRRLLVRYPAPPLTILGRIYLQALRLKLRGVPYHPHPAR